MFLLENLKKRFTGETLSELHMTYLWIKCKKNGSPPCIRKVLCTDISYRTKRSPNLGWWPIYLKQIWFNKIPRHNNGTALRIHLGIIAAVHSELNFFFFFPPPPVTCYLIEFLQGRNHSFIHLPISPEYPENETAFYPVHGCIQSVHLYDDYLKQKMCFFFFSCRNKAVHISSPPKTVSCGIEGHAWETTPPLFVEQWNQFVCWGSQASRPGSRTCSQQMSLSGLRCVLGKEMTQS